MINIFLKSVFVLWIFFVIYSYYGYHPEQLDAFSNSVGVYSSFFIILAVIFGGFFLYKYFVEDRDKVEFKKSPILLIGTGFLSLFITTTVIFYKTPLSEQVGYFSAISSMFSKLGPSVLTLFVIFSLSFLLGDTLSKILKINWAEEKKGVVNIGFGMTVILLLLFVIGAFGFLTAKVIFILGCLLFVICYKFSFGNYWDWLIAKNKQKEEFKFFSIDTFLWLSLFYMISLNILDVIRPMPIGWDDMGVYLNMPQRIAEDASALSGMMGQAYMFLTSIGYSIWPQYIGDNVAMFINWFGGILSVFAVFIFVKRFFNDKMALFSSVFYYFMPMITFQSALDMKMDPPLFFFMVTGALILFDKGHGILDKINDVLHRVSYEDKVKWAIGGMILATAFFIKVTTAMELFALIALISFFVFNWKTSLGVIFLETAIFLPLFSEIPEFSEDVKSILTIVFALIGASLIYISKVKKHQLIHFKDIAVSAFIGFFIVALPWLVFNYKDSQSISFGGLVGGAFHDAPKIDYEKIGVDPLGEDSQYCISTGAEEEKGRYIGYDQPFFQKYFTLPWKNTMNTETKGYYLDIGFMYLALIPGIFLLGIWRKWGKKEWGVLILFCVNWFFWAFSAYGIPWYGLFGFLPALILVGMVLFDEDARKTNWKYFYFLLIIISIGSFAYLRETKTGNSLSLSYSFGLKTGDEVVDGIVPTYRTTVDYIDFYPRSENDPGYVYRIGTFIPYFVKDARRVMIDDSQLDTFRCIDGDGTDDKRTLDRLKKLGFKFFILDTNTPTIERFEHIKDEIPQEGLVKLDSLNKQRDDVVNKVNNKISEFKEKYGFDIGSLSASDFDILSSLKGANEDALRKGVISGKIRLSHQDDFARLSVHLAYINKIPNDEFNEFKKLREESAALIGEIRNETSDLLYKYGSLHKKFARFIEFAEDNFKVVYSRPKNGIAFMVIE